MSAPRSATSPYVTSRRLFFSSKASSIKWKTAYTVALFLPPRQTWFINHEPRRNLGLLLMVLWKPLLTAWCWSVR